MHTLSTKLCIMKTGSCLENSPRENISSIIQKTFPEEMIFILDLASGNFNFIHAADEEKFQIENLKKEGFKFLSNFCPKEKYLELLSAFLQASFNKETQPEHFQIELNINFQSEVYQFYWMISGKESQKKISGIISGEKKYFTPSEILSRLNRIIEISQTLSPPSVSHIHPNANSLSKRELQVLKLLSEGYSSKMIAERLFISPHTAESHRKNMMEKFGVKNTAEMIHVASRYLS